MIIWEPVCDGPWNWIEEFLDCSSFYARRTNKNQLSVCWKVAKLSGWFVRRAHQRLARSNFTLDGVCDASPTSIQRRSNKQQVYGARVKGRQTGAARNFCEKTRSRVCVRARAKQGECQIKGHCQCMQTSAAGAREKLQVVEKELVIDGNQSTGRCFLRFAAQKSHKQSTTLLNNLYIVSLPIRLARNEICSWDTRESLL